MGITPFSGPVIGVRDNPLGSVGTGSANQNSQSAPWLALQGYGIHDQRYPFTYKNGGDPTTQKAYGYFASSYMPVLDQAMSAISAVNIAAAQAITTAVAMTLVSSSGAGITVATSITRADNGATVTGLLAIDTAMAGVGFGQDATLNIWDPTKSVARNVRITSNADDSAGLFTVIGYDLYGYPMSEAITGTNNSVANGKKAFKYITSVTPSGTVASTSCSVGTGDVIGLPLRCDRIPYLSVWWGNPQGMIIGPGGSLTAAEVTLVMPFQLKDFTNAEVYKLAIPYGFTVKSALWRTADPATTTSKLATLTLTVGGTAVTGGVIALTTANTTTAGSTVAASAISGAATTSLTATTIEWTASAVTAFVEGDGWLEILVTNNELQGGTFTAAVTTAASTTTGDVRGTIALPTASDGTKRLTIFLSPMVSNLSINGLWGVAQNLASNNGT